VSSELAVYITRYGYLAVFLLVFAQELGLPNPVTNEFVLLFSGYLAFAGVLNLWLAVLSAVSADCLGTTVLYAVFYRCGATIMANRPGWFPVSKDHIDRLGRRIAERQRWGIYVGRLMPFLRGYASVAAGLLGIGPRVFLPAVVVSGVTWSGGYVFAGRLLGPYWKHIATKMGRAESFVLIAALLLSTTLIGRAVLRKRTGLHRNQL
jgi:membrane protein DedA with SNARE-associated domain